MVTNLKVFCPNTSTLHPLSGSSLAGADRESDMLELYVDNTYTLPHKDVVGDGRMPWILVKGRSSACVKRSPFLENTFR